MLTQAHLRALRDNSSAAVRADIAAVVADELSAGVLSDDERRLAAEILELLARDLNRLVRQALAEHVKASPALPHEIAQTLARDIEDGVALPVLEHSPLLDEDDLLVSIAEGNPARQMAVARRPVVPARVAEALVETTDRAVVTTVLANRGADIREPLVHKLLRVYGADEAILAQLVERPLLPLAMCAALIAALSGGLRDRLVERHCIPPVIADELIRSGRERALTALTPERQGLWAEALAQVFHARGWLSPTLLLRSLFCGDLGFFEAAMAQLTGAALANVRALIYDRGPGFAAIYRKAGLPHDLMRAFRIGITAVLEGYLARGQAAFGQRVVQQLVLSYDDLSPGPLEQLVSQLSRRVPTARRGDAEAKGGPRGASRKRIA